MYSKAFLNWPPLGYHIHAVPRFESDVVMYEEIEEFAKRIAKDNLMHIYEQSDGTFVIKVRNYQCAVRLTYQDRLRNGTLMYFLLLEGGMKAAIEES